ncbi:hypothetical protein PoMZ_10899 [Pyricularia oryzae]|uniref:Acyl-CoA thioesterase-like C-terminal domain-containing protein n=1 Tax=Pyricularia oryzae TaxID=318829 RepID=A0A4P7NJ08_PYROR|nr:hypothetical protein PoMZ_10899 [Pyricularia oryzae]
MASKDCRLSFQEIMELTELPVDAEAAQRGVVRRFMSRRPAWLPGSDIERIEELCGEGKPFWHAPLASFGGHVYAQSGMAAARVVDAEEKAGPSDERQRRRGVHTVHGYFTTFVFSDRPIFYEVSPITNAQFSFKTYLVTARQPTETSSRPPRHGWDCPGGNNSYRFPDKDAKRQRWSDLKPICFSATVSFKLPEPHAAGVSEQEESAQRRFSSILALRRPEDWLPAPRLDVDDVVAALERRGDVDCQRRVGSFPAVDMKKVDMTAYNAGRPLFEQRQLILYRILRPLQGTDAVNDNAHALVHAYEADRNGLLMAWNAIKFNSRIKMVTSMSYSFVVHTNLQDAIMRHESQTLDGKSEWWLQEVFYTRAANGRVLMEAKIWSPHGVHVATIYQDGMVRAESDDTDTARQVRL